MLPNFSGASVIIGTHKTLTQSMVDAVYPARAADIHGFSGVTAERNYTLIAIGKLVAEFAKICNFTPKVTNLEKIGDGSAMEGTMLIVPFVVPSVVPKFYSPVVQTHASVSLSVLQYFNFLYCAADTELKPTNFKLLLKPLSFHCWVGIILSLALIPLAVSFKNRGFSHYIHVVFMALAALLNQVVASNRYERRKEKSKLSRNKLILLWVMASFVLSNLYGGVLTSSIIAPAENDVIKDVNGLVRKGHRLIYTDKGFFPYIMLMVKEMVSKGASSSSLGTLFNGKLIKPTLPGMIDSLALEDKTALFGPFALVLTFWSLLTERIAKVPSSKLSLKKRRCHTGNVLDSAYSVPEVWIFRDLQNKREMSDGFARTFNLLHHSGIHSFWMDIFFRIQVSSRAQDVNRFKSKTEIFVELPLEPMGLYNSSISIIFFIYGILIFVCFCGLLAEILWSRNFQTEEEFSRYHADLSQNILRL